MVKNKADTPRSFNVKTERGNLRRNRRHLIKTNENPDDINVEQDVFYDCQTPDEQVDQTPVLENQDTQAYVTRSGRTVNKPNRYGDYVYS